jgi:phosphatidylinositol alpha-1,6-mannosyltransferase
MKTKNNTLLFTLEYPPFRGGVANVYGNIVKYWPNDSIKVLAGENLCQPHWIFSLRRLWQAIRKYQVKTVLVGQLLPLGTITYLLSQFKNIDYTVFLHGMDIALAVQIPRKKRLAKKILANAKHIVALNSYVPKVLQKEFGNAFAGKVVVVNPGVKSEVRSQKSEVRSLLEKYHLQDKMILLQVGRLVERKGVDKTLEALPEVLKECKDLVYVVVGDGPAKGNLEFRIQNLKLSDDVILITDASDEDAQAWYELCDIFIMPARDIDGDVEGFGIVYLEANAHGKPVIAGDSGGVRDAVKPDLNGLLVNPESAAEIRDAILKLCKDEFLRRRLGQQGREWVKSFVWEKKVEKIYNVSHI